jgi:hypothetical protein
VHIIFVTFLIVVATNLQVKLNSISSETFNSLTKRPQNSMLNPSFLLDLLEHKVEKYWLDDICRVIDKIKLNV